MRPEDLESTIIDDTYKKALSQTVQDTQFGEEGTLELCKTVPDGDGPIDPEKYINTIQLGAAHDKLTTHFELGIDSIPDQEDIQVERFKVENVIGEGGTSRVYRVFDEDLGRFIAVKRMLRRPKKSVSKTTLEGQTTQSPSKSSKPFLHEARMTAQLEHPNILPIYDVGQTEGGDLYLSMRHIDGTSLGDVLRDATSSGAHILGSINDRTTMFLKVCDAIAYAHNAGICHQDIKPDNIMLGHFGEVLVVDWGTASMVSPHEDDTKRLIGTPVYMSPEQARREKADERSDIYCLGATLFHMLTLRWPMFDKDAKAFWQKKREGHIDLPTHDEWEALPTPLLNIALKAMSADPEQRYLTVQALMDDVKAFQAGAAVSAYKEGLSEFLWRYVKRHRMALSIIAVLLMCAVVVGNIFYELKLKSMVKWGRQPAYTLTFDESNFEEQWIWQNGKEQAEFKEGKLIAHRPYATSAIFKQKLVGNVAFEMEAKMLSGHAAGDLSFIYCEDYEIVNGRVNLLQPMYLQTGARGNTYAAIGTARTKLNVANHRLVPDRTYRIRGEIDENVLRLIVDGEIICEYEAEVPYSAGYIGFYTYFPGKQINSVKIYSQGSARHNPPTIAGDAFFKIKDYAQAIRLYDEVVKSSRDKDIIDKAKFKKGLAYHKLDDLEQAKVAWSGVTTRNYAQKIKLLMLEEDYETDQNLDPIPALKESWRKYNARHERLRTTFAWKRLMHTAIKLKPREHIEALLNLKTELFPNDYSTDVVAIQALENLDRYEEIVSNYAHLEYESGTALMSLGRYQDFLDSTPHEHHAKFWARTNLNRADENLTHKEAGIVMRVRALDQMGRYEEILKLLKPAKHKDHRIKALLHLGRYEEIIEIQNQLPDETIWEAKLAYKLTDRYKAAMEWYEIPKDSPEYLRDHGLYKQIYKNPDMAELVSWDVARSMLYDQILTIEGPALRANKSLRAEYKWMKAFLAYTSAKPQSLEDKLKLLNPLKELYESKVVTTNSHYAYTKHFIYPLLGVLDGGMTRVEFNEVMQKHATNYSKRNGLRTYHTAKYLNGSISKETFLAQPRQLRIKEQEFILTTFKLDMAGETNKALPRYKAFLAKLPYQRLGGPVFDAFLNWRIEVLIQATQPN